MKQELIKKLHDKNANKHPLPKGRGIHIITSHRRKPVSRSFNLWILACARMTVFAASCGESNPQEIKKISAGKTYIKHIPDKAIKSDVDKGFEITTDFSRASERELISCWFILNTMTSLYLVLQTF